MECVFLCSYHAYNRCDAAGVVPKRLAAHEKRQSKGPVGAAAYAELVNSSSYGNHVAFSFPAINRGADVFPVDLAKLPHARQCCDVLYHRTRADGVAVREEGVVWFRMVTDVDVQYQLHDLLPREGKYMCAQCSDTAQEPLFHAEVSECPRATLPVDLAQVRAALATPAPERIQGPQLAKKSKSGQPDQPKRKRKAVDDDRAVGAFPCKAVFCSKLHYKTAGNSNKHMASKHSLEALAPYPNPPKPRKKRAPASAPVPAPELAPLAGMLFARAARVERVVACLGAAAEPATAPHLAPRSALEEPVPPAVAPLPARAPARPAGWSLQSARASSSEASSESSQEEQEEEDGSESSESEDPNDADDEDADPGLEDAGAAAAGAAADERARNEQLLLERTAARDAQLARAREQAVPPGAPRALCLLLGDVFHLRLRHSLRGRGRLDQVHPARAPQGGLCRHEGARAVGAGALAGTALPCCGGTSSSCVCLAGAV